MIETITVTIKGKGQFNLTLSQAEELYQDLKKLFGKSELVRPTQTYWLENSTGTLP